MSNTSFQVVYGGQALTGNAIDILELAPSSSFKV